MSTAIIVALMVIYAASIGGTIWLQDRPLDPRLGMITLIAWILLVIELCRASLERLYATLTDPIKVPRRSQVKVSAKTTPSRRTPPKAPVKKMPTLTTPMKKTSATMPVKKTSVASASRKKELTQKPQKR